MVNFERKGVGWGPPLNPPLTYATSSVNQMWIFKNSKELLANLKAQNFSQINSIKTYDFLTLYTTIPHEQLKSRLFDIIDNCFFNKNEKIIFSDQSSKHYFIRYHSDSSHKYSEVEIKKMLEFLIDNIFVVVGGEVFQQSVGISMGTNCAPLLADLLLYSCEAEFIQKLLHEKKKSLAVAFNLTFRYIGDVLSIRHICRFDIAQ
jgi:hypothetical protein